MEHIPLELKIATGKFVKQLEAMDRLIKSSLNIGSDIIELYVDISFSNLLKTCKEFEQEEKNEKYIKDARKWFHRETNDILSKSYCINRTRTWPQGHQGDYETLEAVYRNTPLSERIGRYLDLLMMDAPLAHAVRNRITKLEEILKDVLQSRKNPSVLNIACGSCREVLELSNEIYNSKAKITCIDLDNDALSFAANRLSYTGISPLTSDQVNLRKYNALRMFDHGLNMSEFGKQDIIYSVGFFDYIESKPLAKIFNALYNLLNPGGKLIASFKDANRYDPTPYHYIVDWDGFKQRTPDDFRKIFSDAEIPTNAITSTREDSGIILFYTITKPDDITLQTK